MGAWTDIIFSLRDLMKQYKRPKVILMSALFFDELIEDAETDYRAFRTCKLDGTMDLFGIPIKINVSVDRFILITKIPTT